MAASATRLRPTRPIFPFTALIGQERMKRALLLNAVNPRLGGVLIRGEKGTAKSTAVRALASLLPEIEVVVGCHYGCDPARPDDWCADCLDRPGEPVTATRRVPIVNLPVGATEDRLTGTIDIEEAIAQGRRRFEPGLLAAAHRGILYVDEVNLLNDHLVDVLLDVAAMGTNYVEREGISLSHPAQLILVGTMNPEEGDLRPQLLDRFALAVEVQGIEDRAERAEIVRRRIAFEDDPVGFVERWRGAEEEERARILAARDLLSSVVVDEQMLDLITHLCTDFQVDGLRGDIVMYKTAATLAAYAGRDHVQEEDVRAAAELALLHRRRRRPFEQPRLDPGDLDRSIDQHRDQTGPPDAPPPPPPPPIEHRQSADAPEPPDGQQSSAGAPDQVIAAGDPYAVRALVGQAPERRETPKRAGRRSRVRAKNGQGAYVRSRPAGEPVTDLALDATFRAAAPHQKRRRASEPHGPALRVRPTDLQEKVRESRAANVILFAVDASGSMAARRRMREAKQAVLSLLLDAYQKRDRIGLIAFRGEQADLLLPPTSSVDLAERRLQSLPTGGRTPLAHALQLGLLSFERHRTNHPEDVPLLLLVSDGRANVALGRGDPATQVLVLAEEIRARGIQAVVIDTETGPVRLGLCRPLSEALGATYLPLEQLRAGDLIAAANAGVGRA